MVSARIFITALRTGTSHITVGKKTLAFRAKQLFGCVLGDITVFIKVCKNSLSNFRLLRRGRAPKMVKSDVEPFINIFVQGMIVIAQFSRRFVFFKSFCFGCSAVFIVTADIKRFIAAASAKTCKNVGG